MLQRADHEVRAGRERRFGGDRGDVARRRWPAARSSSAPRRRGPVRSFRRCRRAADGADAARRRRARGGAGASQSRPGDRAGRGSRRRARRRCRPQPDSSTAPTLERPATAHATPASPYWSASSLARSWRDVATVPTPTVSAAACAIEGGDGVLAQHRHPLVWAGRGGEQRTGRRVEICVELRPGPRAGVVGERELVRGALRPGRGWLPSRLHRPRNCVCRQETGPEVTDAATRADENSSLRATKYRRRLAADPRIRLDRRPERRDVRRAEVRGEVLLGRPPLEHVQPPAVLGIGRDPVVEAAVLVAAGPRALDEGREHGVAVARRSPSSRRSRTPRAMAPASERSPVSRDRLKLPPDP